MRTLDCYIDRLNSWKEKTPNTHPHNIVMEALALHEEATRRLARAAMLYLNPETALARVEAVRVAFREVYIIAESLTDSHVTHNRRTGDIEHV